MPMNPPPHAVRLGDPWGRQLANFTPAAEPPRLDPPLVRFEVIDEAAARAVLQGEHLAQRGLFRLWSELVEPVEVGGWLRLEPTDRGQAGAIDPGLKIYEAVIAAIGVDPDDDVNDSRWLREGQAAVRAVLIDPPSSPLDKFTGTNETRLREAEAEGRRYALPATAIEVCTKRTFVSRRSLLTPGTQAARLAATAQESAEQVTQATDVARQLAEPRSLRAQRLQAVSRRRDLILPMLEPFVGCCGPQFEDETHIVFVFPDEVGLRVVPFDAAGWALVDPDTVLVLRGGVPDMDQPTSAYLRLLRRRYGTDQLDFGPVGDRWTDRGHERARAVLREQAASVFVNIAPHRAWRQPFLVNLIVRGLLVHPTAFVQMAIDELDRVHEEQNKPVALPGPFDAQVQALTSLSPFFGPASAMTDISRVENGRRVLDLREPADRERPSSNPTAAEWLGALAITAADSGDVGVGELLHDDEATTSTAGAAPAQITKRKTTQKEGR
jgi:hypothetical protein